jgi:hypothetical protein
MDKELITYKETFKNGQGQSSNSIGLYLIHPISMGTVKQIDMGAVYQTYPPSISNDQGEFVYNGTQYRMYRINSATAGETWLFKIRMCD